MSPALLYLWLSLLKRRALRFRADLRRPGRLIGLAAVIGLVGFLYYYREHEVFATLTRIEVLVGGALIMLGGSALKGFHQRGLVFEPADVEFLFTGPFSERQILFYRLLPSYLFAVLQGLIFLGLFGPHLKHPLVATVCFVLFQIACFHVATAASLFAGAISEQAHHRLRWMMLAACFLLLAAYFRVAWDLRIVPSLATLPLSQLLFYPAVSMSDMASDPAIHEWLARWPNGGVPAGVSRLALYLVSFALGATGSLWGLFKLRASVFETSLDTTARMADRRVLAQQGRRVISIADKRRRSACLPNFPLFRGVGAIVWKNLVVARRSRRELGLALVFTVVFAVPLTALLWLIHDAMARSGELPAREAEGFHAGIAMFVGFLAFLLQRALPFDFRTDAHHLVGFRALPVSPFALAAAELTVPSGLCLIFQGIAVGLLAAFGRFEWTLLVLLVVAYPAIALAVNGVWNLHYLLVATRRVSGRTASSSAVGTLMVVALSFLIFYPAGWTANRIFDHLPIFTFSAAGFVAVQYVVDFLLVLLLAQLFQRFEVSRDAH